MTDHWDGEKRSDGLKISRTIADAYVVVRPNGEIVSRCPCCGAIILTSRAAKLIADGVWPVTP